MTEIDALMAGFCGGCFASIIIMGLYYWHFKVKTVQYICANDDLKNSLKLKNAVEDIKVLRSQINELYEELDHKP